MRTEPKGDAGLETLALDRGKNASETRRIANAARAYATALECEAQERTQQAKAQRDYAALLDAYATTQESVHSLLTPPLVAMANALVAKEGR